MTTTAVAPSPIARDGMTPCAHCGLPAFVTPHAEDEPVFCCSACATAWTIISEHGLGAYHMFGERRASAVRPSGREFSDFDHEAFQSRYVTRDDDGMAQVSLALEGVHCASCVWLIERVPLLVSGVARAELDVRLSRASVTWDPSATSLSEIARTLDALGYTPHPYRGGERAAMRRRDDRAMLVRIGVAGALATNVMLASLALYAGELNTMEAGTLQLFRWIGLALTVPSLAWPGRLFFTGAWAALRTGTVHMDVPIALALGAAFVRGAINTVSGSGPVYFDGVSALVFLLLVGRYVQARGQRAATDATEQLFALTPATARVVRADGTVIDVPADAVGVGTVITVHAGETIPVDGVVTRGASSLSHAILTGESADVHRGVGDTVYAGTLNRAAELQVRVIASGDDSRLARILAQVDESARRRAPVVLLADRLASRVVAVVLMLAVVTYAIWVRRDSAAAWDHAIALLVVTCPCALALATPLAMSAAVGRAARVGIFVKGGDTLESLSRPGWLVLDKTRTLTVGQVTLASWDGDDALRPRILALEATSTHVIAAGFRRAWPDVAPGKGMVSTHIIGGGISGVVDGREILIGSPRFIAAQLPHAIVPQEMVNAGDLTPVLVAIDGQVVARARFADVIRPDAAASLATLRARGWRTMLLSGDAAAVTDRVGRELGFGPDEIVSQASPEEKAARVRDLVASMSGGRTARCVAMVGDGVNDAAAIAAATVGIGVHGGAEASLATADVALTRDGLSMLVSLDTGARRAMRVIRRNIAWSFGYNAIGVVLAMSGNITPLVAAIMMPVSSLTVVLGSWLGRTFTEETR
ncbi:MAG TPA: cation-translocating P-type ATPase [Gemmatimonadaceae bacterium]|nr:cation-translocating P-type ATPase [Gemmatimonadaceae bacterium]